MKAVLLAAFVPFVIGQAVNPAAFNPLLTNSISIPGGPVLYYNGSGPVPPYNSTTPTAPSLPALTPSQLEDKFYAEIVSINKGTIFPDNCSTCLAVVEILHLAALSLPTANAVDLLVRECNLTQPAGTDCAGQYTGVGNQGSYLVQLYASMTSSTGDFAAWCHYSFSVCNQPPVIQINESQWFSAKPAGLVAPPPSGEVLNVIHLSDTHLDSRYDIGAEANCSAGQCCRPISVNTALHTNSRNASIPASRFGEFICDTPPDLFVSAFANIPKFTDLSTVSFAIFTGDVVSHDPADQLSAVYNSYEEEVTYATFKAGLGGIPLYATLGNHDSAPQAWAVSNSLLGNNVSNELSWNYNLLSGLWLSNGWIDNSTATYAATHYGGYSYVTPHGLKIVSLNTDFWYTANVFNYYNFTNPDPSGMLAFLISELEVSEAANQRVWIIGHVLSGYDGSNPLPNPTALFYSIVRRFSPATIAGIFWGHTHEDQLIIYYDYLSGSLNSTTGLRNTTMVDYTSPLNVAFVGPSIVPITGNNAGWRVYQVDAKTFNVLDHQTYFANISQSHYWTDPVWNFEYDARTIYDPLQKWGANHPLNATFWHNISSQMLNNGSLVSLYNFLETKSSVETKNCTSARCIQQKVCYIRSGSAALGHLCGTGNGPT